MIIVGKRFNSNFLSAINFASPRYSKNILLKLNDNNVKSYEDMNVLSGKYANLLNHTYNVKKGDRVLARITKSVDSLALYLATLRLGAIYIPVNPMYTEKETTHFINDAEPKLFVTLDYQKDSLFKDRISHVVDENKLSQESTTSTPDLSIESVSDNDIACICYTSGTTGLPKGAMITHGGLTSSASSLSSFWKFTSHDTLLHMLPFYHIHGLFLSLSCSLFSHSSMIWLNKFSVDEAVKYLPKSTVMMGVPTFYTRLLKSSKFVSQNHSNIRLFVSGSAPLTPAVWREFKEVVGNEIVERYGMTETMVITSNPIEGKKIPGSVGIPLPETKIRINKDNVVEVKSNSLFKGYWKNPEKTKAEFTNDGYFITGDMGKIEENGYLYILGRNKDLIISGGLNVYPKEVEDVIDHIPFVSESAVIGLPHSDFGECVIAVVARKESLDDKKQEEEIKEICKKELAKYKIPKKVIFVDELPRNSMSKIQKNILRDTYKRLQL
uniref:AMP-binding domain-containing protein n=1 Tax=Parastrongyloides trichosuri TaxID=131310 RepID=A0A0N4Z4N9_PARTI